MSSILAKQTDLPVHSRTPLDHGHEGEHGEPDRKRFETNWRERRRPRRTCPVERALDLCEGVLDIAAALYNVSGRELRKPGRNATGVTRVRQIAMYVAHVSLGLSMPEIGRGFGRDRTTVLHACHLVEDMRDDPEFDRMVSLTERISLAAFRAGGLI